MRNIIDRTSRPSSAAAVFVALIVVLLASSTSLAQPDFNAVNAVYAEGYGNGLLYSVNYDRLLSERFSFRVGFSYIKLDDFIFSDITFTFIPIMINALFGPGNHKLELGGGIDVVSAASGSSVNDKEIKSGVLLTGTVGYRYQRRAGGFLFRIGFTPIIAPYEDGGILPLPGISVGASF